MASGSRDKSIKVWDLDDCSLIRTIDDTDVYCSYSLMTVQSGGQKILASAYGSGKIKLWSVSDYECIGTIIGQI